MPPSVDPAVNAALVTATRRSRSRRDRRTDPMAKPPLAEPLLGSSPTGARFLPQGGSGSGSAVVHLGGRQQRGAHDLAVRPLPDALEHLALEHELHHVHGPQPPPEPALRRASEVRPPAADE